MIGRVGERRGDRVLRLQPARAAHRRHDPGRRDSRRLPNARRGRLRPPAGQHDRQDPQPARLSARGRRLMAANTTRPSEGGLFARELTRAVAQRGRLDPVYQTLSDHWTLILQRLFPVWCLLGPGLADPGHIELASRTVYLDSDDLLGSRERTSSPARSAATDPRHVRGGDPRGPARQAQQAVDRRARHRR